MTTSAEAEFAEKLQQMEARHEQELSEFAANHNDKAGEPEESVASAAPGIDDTQSATTTTTSTIAEGDIIQSSTNTSSIEEERLRKLEKARRKRDAKKEKERQRQDDLEREAANAGPSMRAMELEALDMQLKPLSLRIVEIPSDGNCLYRAVAAQCGSDYVAIRKCVLCVSGHGVCFVGCTFDTCGFVVCLSRFAIARIAMVRMLLFSFASLSFD